MTIFACARFMWVPGMQVPGSLDDREVVGSIRQHVNVLLCSYSHIGLASLAAQYSPFGNCGLWTRCSPWPWDDVVSKCWVMMLAWIRQRLQVVIFWFVEGM